MKLTKSIVEDASLDWLKGLGYEVLSGLVIASGELGAERAVYKQVFLFERLQAKLDDLNPKIPLEGLRDALLPKLRPGELRVADVEKIVHNPERQTV